MPANNYGLLLDDPEGSSEETGMYRDADAGEEDTGLQRTRELRDPAMGTPDF